MSQGLGKLTGLQDKFDFAGVAAAGIGSAAGDFVGARVGGSKLGNYAASSAASAIANAATRSAINGENFGRNLVAAIPDLIAGILQRAVGSAVEDKRIDKLLADPKTPPEVRDDPDARSYLRRVIEAGASTRDLRGHWRESKARHRSAEYREGFLDLLDYRTLTERADDFVIGRFVGRC